MPCDSERESAPTETFEQYVAGQLKRSTLPLTVISQRSGVRPETLSRIRCSRRAATTAQAVSILAGLGADEDVGRLCYSLGKDVPSLDSSLLELYRQYKAESLGFLELVIEHEGEADPRWFKPIFSMSRESFQAAVKRYRDRLDDLSILDGRR